MCSLSLIIYGKIVFHYGYIDLYIVPQCPWGFNDALAIFKSYILSVTINNNMG